MKTFKQFTAEWQRKKSAGAEKPYLNKDADGFYSAMAVMGSHSDPKKSKKKLKEDAEGRIKDYSPWDHPVAQPKKDKDEFFQNYIQPIHEDLSDHFTHYSEDHLSNGIHPYTEDSSALNKQLINRHIGNRSMDDDHHFTAHKLDEAMKVNKTPYAMTLYSGSSHSPEHYPIDEATGKRHMVFPAFTSTSINPATANGFKQKDFHAPKDAKYDGNHVYKFHVPEGHPALYLENHTKVKNEHEMLLHRGMKGHVAAEPRTIEKADPTYRGNVTMKTHIWDVHVLPHDGNQKELG